MVFGFFERKQKVDPDLERQLRRRGIFDVSGDVAVSPEAVRSKRRLEEQISQEQIRQNLEQARKEPVEQEIIRKRIKSVEQKSLEKRKKKAEQGVPIKLLPFPGLTKKVKIDPDLKRQLEKRGKTEKIKELEQRQPTLVSRFVSEIITPESLGGRRNRIQKEQDLSFEQADKLAREELLKEAIIPFNDNVSFSVDFGAGIKNVGARSARVIRNAIKKGVKDPKVINRLINFSENKFARQGEEALNDLNKIFKQEKKDLTKDRLEKARKFPEKIRTALVSKFTPLTPFERDVNKAAGVVRPEKQLPLQSKFELFSGANGKAEVRVRDFEDIVIKPVKDKIDDFNNFLALQRIKSRLNTGLDRTKVADWTLDKVDSAEQSLRQKVGDESFNQFRGQAVKYDRLMDESLKGLVESDYMSNETYNIIKKNNDFYAKFKVLKYIEDENREFIKGTGRTINVGKDNIVKSMTGINDTEFQLQDLLSSGAETIYQNKIIAEKNKLMQSFRPFADIDEKGTFITKLRTEKNVVERTEITKKLSEKIKQTKQSIRKLKFENRNNNKVLSQLNKIEKNLADQELDLVRNINLFLDPDMEKIVSTGLKVDTIPSKLLLLANKVAKFDAFDDLMKSPLKNELRKMAELGEFERLGFVSRTAEQDIQKFFNSAKGKGITPSKVVQKKSDKVVRKSTLVKKAKKIERTKEKFGFKEVEQMSSQDAVNFLNRQVDDLKLEKKDLRDKLKELSDVDIKQLGDKDLDKVSFYTNGIREEFAVNKDVANAIKGLNQEQIGLAGKTLAQFAKPFRWGVTTANAGFQLVNALFADIPRNLIQFKYGNNFKSLARFPLDTVYSYMSSFKGNFGKMNSLYRDFLESGAANSTIAREIQPEAFKRKVGGIQSKNPKIVLDTIAKFANAIEEGGKLLGMKRGLPEFKKGTISKEQLADEVRKFSGSPDFLRRGDKTAPINLMLMFFNARLQGATLDLKRLAGATGGKEAAQSWAKLSAIVGVPATTLAIYNRENHKEDLEKLSDTERDNNYIIFRDEFDTNERGEMFRKYWKVPKRELSKWFANLIEGGVNFAYDKDPERAKEVGVKFLEDISPVSIAGDDITERGESFISGLNPLLKAPVEYITNRNTFFHSDQVPQFLYGIESDLVTPAEQYFLNTPKFYKWLGKQTDQSPIKLQNLFSSFTGGLLKEDPVTKAVKRFQGQGRLDLTPEEKKQLKSVLKNVESQAGEGLSVNRSAQEIYEEIGDLSIEEQKPRLAELKKNGYLTEEVFERYQKVYQRMSQDFNDIDFQLQKLNVTNGRRALSMYNLINKMSPEEQQTILTEWKAKKLLSEEVFKQLNWLGNNSEQAKKISETLGIPQ